MEHPFHPIANEYPPMSAAELDELTQALAARGYWPELGKVVTLDGLILDGRNRYLAARKAGVEISPHMVEYSGDKSDYSLRLFVESANEHRRHLTTEQRQAIRQSRIERVAQRRQDGASTRQIAREENVSEVQVRRDIETAKSTAPPGAVEPKDGKVTGRDGKQRPAKRTSTPEPRQPEHDDVQSHPDDEVQRHPDDDQPPPKPKPSQPRNVDAEGTPIPPRLRDVFADAWLVDTLAQLKAWHEGVNTTPVLSGVRKRFSHYPWLRLQDFIGQVENIDEAFALALETLRQALPYAVCGGCVGEGCGRCLHSGYLPQWKWEELRGEGLQ